MSENSSNSSGIGNTNSMPEKDDKQKKQISPSVHWCFTLNNWKADDATHIHGICSSSSIKYIFQSEVGENGTPHLQGYIQFKKKVRPMSLFNNKSIHWEKCRSIQASIDYCSKSDTWAGDRWTNIKFPKPIKIIETLRPWQQEIVEMISQEADDRSIYWYYDYDGNIGKSVFCKYLAVKYDAFVVSGKSADIKYGVIKYKEKHDIYPDIIILDVPRCNLDYINYEAMESIKNGLFFSTKYESDMVVMNSPHLLVFANEAPNTSKMSADRWKIKLLE